MNGASAKNGPRRPQRKHQPPNAGRLHRADDARHGAFDQVFRLERVAASNRTDDRVLAAHRLGQGGAFLQIAHHDAQARLIGPTSRGRARAPSVRARLPVPGDHVFACAAGGAEDQELHGRRILTRALAVSFGPMTCFPCFRHGLGGRGLRPQSPQSRSRLSPRFRWISPCKRPLPGRIGDGGAQGHHAHHYRHVHGTSDAGHGGAPDRGPKTAMRGPAIGDLTATRRPTERSPEPLSSPLRKSPISRRAGCM